MGVFGDFSRIGTLFYDIGTSPFRIGEDPSDTSATSAQPNPTRESAGFVADLIFNTIIGVGLVNSAAMDSPEEIDQVTHDPVADLSNVNPGSIAHLLRQLRVSDHLSSSMVYGDPIINFQIGERTYHAVIGDEIEVFEGLNDGADIQFNTSEECFLGALAADDPVRFLRNSGQIQFITVTDSKPELLAKGYLGLKEQLLSEA